MRCPRCHGTGQTDWYRQGSIVRDTCTDCNGTGDKPDFGYVMVPTKRMPGVTWTLVDILELCEGLVQSQIREERINSIEELHGMLKAIRSGLEIIEKAKERVRPKSDC